MIPDSPALPSSTATEHRGWTLQTTWFRSSLGLSEGWVVFATRPSASHRVNIGRWSDHDQALEQGRAYVDRRIDDRGALGANLPVQKRKQ